jgi:hypothetical protein
MHVFYIISFLVIKADNSRCNCSRFVHPTVFNVRQKQSDYLHKIANSVRLPLTLPEPSPFLLFAPFALPFTPLLLVALVLKLSPRHSAFNPKLIYGDGFYLTKVMSAPEGEEVSILSFNCW